jgi:hypothetical protein
VGFEKIPTADVLSPSVATARVPRELVHLVKERVFAQFGDVTPTFCKNKNFVQIGVYIKL